MAMRRPLMLETAIFMRSLGYSARSIREITGLSEREFLRWYALERIAGCGKRGGSAPPAALAKESGDAPKRVSRPNPSGQGPRTPPD
jgi:hypothetical protein